MQFGDAAHAEARGAECIRRMMAPLQADESRDSRP
jgi:hypothetical protein